MARSRRPRRIVVDGEAFDVVRRGRGQYDYTWATGPNPGYGFTSAASDGSGATERDHEDAVRSFLDQVDPRTGHIE